MKDVRERKKRSADCQEASAEHVPCTPQKTRCGGRGSRMSLRAAEDEPFREPLAVWSQFGSTCLSSGCLKDRRAVAMLGSGASGVC